MELVLLQTCISLILELCCGVDFDYVKTYNDYFEETPEEINETVNARRSDKTPKSGKHTTQTTTPITPGIDFDDQDGDIKIHWPTKRRSRHKVTTALIVSFNNKKSSNVLTLTSESISRTEKTTRNIFKEYDYNVDDIDDATVTPLSSALLRQQGKTNKTSLNNDTKTTRNENKTRYAYNQFYNLEPAARFLDFRGQSTEVTKDFNTWYVPEKYPCWDLPLVYGVIGRQKTVDEVFLIRPVKLKHVIDVNNLQGPLSRAQPPDTYLINKWCGVPPCYGDHTLCLYPHKAMSKLCEVDYAVKIPTMLEQIALVNTVNSMRNHVAKGTPKQYPYLPSAANMKQMLYDHDLEQMSKAWLRQCLPGPAPCSAMESSYVTQLECTKYAEHCCVNGETNCIPRQECFIHPIIGCIYTWYWSAGKDLNEVDVKCGHVEQSTYSTAQLIWANTNKMGCAYGHKTNGDVRVVCNFAPGAPFKLQIEYFCGILGHKDITHSLSSLFPSLSIKDITALNFLSTIGVQLELLAQKEKYMDDDLKDHISSKNSMLANISNNWGVASLTRMYQEGWVRDKLHDYSNGTKGLIARLVTRYKFIEDTMARCAADEPIYLVGEPGSQCIETGRKFYNLCYEFRDPTPGYRLVAVLAPVALFTLILYDLFSGVVRHTNY